MKKNYTISITARKFWTLFVPLTILLMIIGGISGLLLVDRFIMPNISGVKNRGILTVPKIGATDWEEARQSLYDVGLRLQIQSWEYNDTIERNYIISQNPLPGEDVKRGRHIFAIVSKGKEVGAIPNVIRMKERIGKNALREAGFSNIIVYKAYSEVVDKDHIARTVPARGTVTSREIPVEVTISKGPKPTHAEVPNVIGETLAEAKKRIEESDLFVGKIEYKVGTSSRPGSVISQSIPPGSNAPLDSRINLVVSASM
jgi:serine/threonine-protein kinase